MDSSTIWIVGLFLAAYWLAYGKRSSSHSCNCNSRSRSIWDQVEGTRYEPVSLSETNLNANHGNPTPRQLGLSTGVISGRPCTPHEAVAEIQLLQFRRTFGRNPDHNEIHPGVWQWTSDGGSTYTTNTRDGSGPRTY
jgi:hypothetical protein